MRDWTGTGAVIAVLCAACVEPERLDPVERLGDDAGHSCPGNFDLFVDDEGLAEVEAQLGGCSEVQGNLRLVLNAGAALRLPRLRAVSGTFDLVGATDAKVDLPLLGAVGALAVRGTGEMLELPALEQVGGGLSIDAVPMRSVRLPALEAVAGELTVKARRLEDLDLPNLVEAGAIEVTCPKAGFGPQVIALPALESATWLSFAGCDRTRAIDLPSLQFVEQTLESALPELVSVRGPRLVRAYVEVSGYALGELALPLLSFGTVSLTDTWLPSIDLPSFLEGELVVRSAYAVSVDLPSFGAGRVRVDSGGDSFRLHAPAWEGGELDLQVSGCARDLYLPRFRVGTVKVSLTDPCVDDVLDLPAALQLPTLSLAIPTSRDGAVGVELAAPRLRELGDLRVEGDVGGPLRFPELERASDVVVVKSSVLSFEAPVLADVALLKFVYDHQMSSLDLPMLRRAKSVYVVRNSSLPACEVDALAEQLLVPPTQGFTNEWNDELAVCE